MLPDISTLCLVTGKTVNRFIFEYTGTGWAKAVAAEGDDIYFAGADYGYAACWKNGGKINLNASSGSDIYSIALHGGILFLCGENYGKACFWVNDKYYPLEVSNVSVTQSRAHSVTVDNDSLDFYISGWYQAGGNNYACY